MNRIVKTIAAILAMACAAFAPQSFAGYYWCKFKAGKPGDETLYYSSVFSWEDSAYTSFMRFDFGFFVLEKQGICDWKRDWCDHSYNWEYLNCRFSLGEHRAIDSRDADMKRNESDWEAVKVQWKWPGRDQDGRRIR